MQPSYLCVVFWLTIIFSTNVYSCSAAASKLDHYDMMLTEATRPSQPPETRILKKGSKFTITCILEDSIVASRSIIWYHNKVQSPTNLNNIKIKKSSRRLRIWISSFSSSNVGFYSCQTSDRKAYSNRRLRLLEECPNEYTGYCHNGGGCIWDGTGAASCFCAKGFSGKRCEKIIPSMPVITDKGNLTSLTIFLVLSSIVLLVGVVLGVAAIRYRCKRTHDMKSRSTRTTTNSVKVAAVCAEYGDEIQKKPLIRDGAASSSSSGAFINSNRRENVEVHEVSELSTSNDEDEMELKRTKRLQRSDAVEEV